MPRWWGGILLIALLISLASVVDVVAQQTVINACVVKTLASTWSVSLGPRWSNKSKRGISS